MQFSISVMKTHGSEVKKGVTVMTISYYAARANLYYLWQLHPEWSHPQFAAALGYSKDWVKKKLAKSHLNEAWS